MKRTPLEISRLVVGILLIAVAVLMYLFSEFSTAGIIAIAILGLVSIVLATRRGKGG